VSIFSNSASTNNAYTMTDLWITEFETMLKALPSKPKNIWTEYRVDVLLQLYLIFIAEPWCIHQLHELFSTFRSTRDVENFSMVFHSCSIVKPMKYLLDMKQKMTTHFQKSIQKEAHDMRKRTFCAHDIKDYGTLRYHGRWRYSCSFIFDREFDTHTRIIDSAVLYTRIDECNKFFLKMQNSQQWMYLAMANKIKKGTEDLHLMEIPAVYTLTVHRTFIRIFNFMRTVGMPPVFINKQAPIVQPMWTIVPAINGYSDSMIVTTADWVNCVHAAQLMVSFYRWYDRRSDSIVETLDYSPHICYLYGTDKREYQYFALGCVALTIIDINLSRLARAMADYSDDMSAFHPYDVMEQLVANFGPTDRMISEMAMYHYLPNEHETIVHGILGVILLKLPHYMHLTNVHYLYKECIITPQFTEMFPALHAWLKDIVGRCPIIDETTLDNLDEDDDDDTSSLDSWCSADEGTTNVPPFQDRLAANVNYARIPNTFKDGVNILYEMYRLAVDPIAGLMLGQFITRYTVLSVHLPSTRRDKNADPPSEQSYTSWSQDTSRDFESFRIIDRNLMYFIYISNTLRVRAKGFEEGYAQYAANEAALMCNAFAYPVFPDWIMMQNIQSQTHLLPVYNKNPTEHLRGYRVSLHDVEKMVDEHDDFHTQPDHVCYSSPEFDFLHNGEATHTHSSFDCMDWNLGT
jgi:hypothetical protein